jgi:lipopolysaccharide kinase (Kdo/WaaP) family protein
VSSAARNTFHVTPAHQPLVREIGLDADAIFDRDDIKPWRTLPDRENCILDAAGTRLHIKRFKTLAAKDEVHGIELLQRADIPTVSLVGWGSLADGRSFVVTLDLVGYRDAEKLVQAGITAFAELLEPTADLAAELHSAGLHHRDLYLCHFFAKLRDGKPPALALIDAARVKPLPRWFGRRWIMKDLAQFWYSTTTLAVTDEQREVWLERYAARRGLTSTASLRRAVVRKSQWIARHDLSLRAKQPTRNISLPQEGPPA